MRKCEIKVVESNGEFKFKLIFIINGEVKKEHIEFCFEDILIEAYNFFHTCVDEFSIDTRMDKLSVDISYKF